MRALCWFKFSRCIPFSYHILPSAVSLWQYSTLGLSVCSQKSLERTIRNPPDNMNLFVPLYNIHPHLMCWEIDHSTRNRPQKFRPVRSLLKYPPQYNILVKAQSGDSHKNICRFSPQYGIHQRILSTKIIYHWQPPTII